MTGGATEKFAAAIYYGGADPLDLVLMGTNSVTHTGGSDVTDSYGVDTDGEVWYEAGRKWAMENGISDGTMASEPITREQFATILWRYAKYKGYDVSVGEDTNILSYEDAFSISEYAIPAMQWACGAGLIEGDGVNLTPKADATRAQAAALFQRFCENAAEK